MSNFRSAHFRIPGAGDLAWDDGGAATDVLEWELWGPDGWAYFVVYPAVESEPSAAQIKAGQRASGSAAVAAGRMPAQEFNGIQSVEDLATGLTPGTTYDVSWVWTSGANDSNVNTGSFTTDASGGGPVVPIFEMHYRRLRAA